MIKALHFLDSFQERRNLQAASTGQCSIPSNLWQKRMSFWQELIVPLINVPKNPCRFWWKTFAKDFESPAIVGLAGKTLEIKKASQQVLKNLYQAGKAVLDPKCSIQLQCNQSLLDTFKAEILSDPSHNIPLPPLDGLPPAPTLPKDFGSTPVRYQDLLPILNSRRNASTPGINMIPYKVYIKCPQITSFLFKIFKSYLRECFDFNHSLGCV